MSIVIEGTFRFTVPSKLRRNKLANASGRPLAAHIGPPIDTRAVIFARSDHRPRPPFAPGTVSRSSFTREIERRFIRWVDCLAENSSYIVEVAAPRHDNSPWLRGILTRRNLQLMKSGFV